MSTAKNIQARVFGGQDAPPSGTTPDSRSLSIQIPSKGPKKQDGTPRDTYQQRLLKRLGTKYDGVERFRLEQDERKERHWKRWGPYLSERQWVRTP